MLFLILFCVAIIATIYASVGHGGASGYLATLLLFGFSPEELRPLVLLMNVVVTSYLLLRTRKQDWLDQRLLVVITVFSIPAAFVGGATQIDASIYGVILSFILGLSALRLIISSNIDSHTLIQPHWLWVSAVGLVLGFIAGFTGIGGGVLLSPLLIFLRWSTVEKSIPLVALFIFANSISGLAGWMFVGEGFVSLNPYFVYGCLGVVLIGAYAGKRWSQYLARIRALRYVLAFVLSLAAIKMMLLAA